MFGSKKSAATAISAQHHLASAKIIPRADHTLSRKHIPASALQVLYGLHKAGFAAFLVGGCVRDLLLGLTPKDFDVATDATPEQVRKIFRHSRIIGRRFKLVHVVFGRDLVEVSTFRKADSNSSDQVHSEHGLTVRDNAYGSIHEIEQDALRRDFSVNALYYNIADFSIVDFVDGLSDLKARVLRVIGEPTLRFREDPVRLLRAVRLAGKIGLHLDSGIVAAIPETSALLAHISPARLFDELLKIIVSGQALKVFELLCHHRLLSFLMPEVAKALACPDDAYSLALFQQALMNTDQRLRDHKTVNPAFMLAVWYWPVLLQYQQHMLAKETLNPAQAFEQASAKTLRSAAQYLHIPKRLTATMHDIWHLQFRFSGRPHKAWLQLLHHPKFRAGYDFLLIRASVNPDDKALADWWQTFYDSDESQQLALIKAATCHGQPAPVKKRRRRRKKPGAPETLS